MTPITAVVTGLLTALFVATGAAKLAGLRGATPASLEARPKVGYGPP